MERITIESEGLGRTTKVLFGDKVLSGITEIEIDPIKPDGVVTAKITFSKAILKLNGIKCNILQK